MWLFANQRVYRLIQNGHCYEVWSNGDMLGVICPVACCLEWGDVLWSPNNARSPRVAARMMIEGM